MRLPGGLAPENPCIRMVEGVSKIGTYPGLHCTCLREVYAFVHSSQDRIDTARRLSRDSETI